MQKIKFFRISKEYLLIQNRKVFKEVFANECKFY